MSTFCGKNGSRRSPKLVSTRRNIWESARSATRCPGISSIFRHRVPILKKSICWPPPPPGREPMNQPAEYKTRINYSKTRQARYIAHLDTIDVICKALRRLQLSYAVTQGCHVRPKISFGPPLPLGHASYCEYFVITLNQEPDVEWLKNALNKEMPQGMEVMSIEHPWSDKKSSAGGEWVQYQLYFKSSATAEQAQTYLLNPDSSFEIQRKGQNKRYVLGKAVQKAKLSGQGDAWLLTAEFIQGIADVPSVSKIVTALAGHLGASRDDFYLLERTSLKEL
ncbi:MAG TPA: hypothetical protein DCG57_17700 [Candidatus Riflebacteria bacterium]|nr:hypothetical protein [Candidatus Riflebacteria bacterium]